MNKKTTCVFAMFNIKKWPNKLKKLYTFFCNQFSKKCLNVLHLYDLKLLLNDVLPSKILIKIFEDCYDEKIHRIALWKENEILFCIIIIILNQDYILKISLTALENLYA